MIPRDDDELNKLNKEELQRGDITFRVGDILVHGETRDQIIGFEEVKMELLADDADPTDDDPEKKETWVEMLAVETNINDDELGRKGRWLPGSIAASIEGEGGYELERAEPDDRK